MKSLFEIGALLISMIIRSKVQGDKRDTFIDIVSLLKDFGIDEFEARDVKRSFDKISDNIVLSCKNVIDNYNIEEARKDVIIRSLTMAYEKLNINFNSFFDASSNTTQLRLKLLNANDNYKKDFDTIECELYERLIEHTSNIIVQSIVNLPDFNAQGILRLNSKIDDIQDKIDLILEQLYKVELIVEDKSNKVKNFEREYRNNILNRCKYVNLFGAGGLEKGYKKYLLEIAYVELELADNNEIVININKIFKENRNIWLIGEAGSGKTTFLQWIAIQSATNTEKIENIRNTIPIMIELRSIDTDKLSLNECIDTVMRDSSYLIPEGWIEEMINKGRFIFLIDGFDEISNDNRDKVMSWLEKVDTKGKCNKIFTARPQVKERPIIKKSNITELRMMSMNKKRLEIFINYWHNAVLAEQLEIDKDDAKSISQNLFERLQQSDSLMKLASNPLLCAMICALHYKNDKNLPTNKRELYEECCKMLVEKRDVEKAINLCNIKLNYETKKLLLARLAYWMMKNNQVEIGKDQAENAIRNSISGMGYLQSGFNEKDVLTYLLERSGLLREPEKDRIDFIHRTFQEYLTAYAISREEDWGYIIEKIGNDTWQETITLCIGYANKDTASNIILKTLEKGKELNEDKKFLFIAIAFMGGAVEIEENLRENMKKNISTMIPPKYDDCSSLAEAGDFAVPYLTCRSEYKKEDRLACIKTLRIVGTIKALNVLKTFFNIVLNDREIIEIGMLIRQFTKQELIENDMINCLEIYFSNKCDKILIIEECFIQLINLFNEEVITNLSKKRFQSLSILNFSDSINITNVKIFKSVTILKLIGDFETTNIIKCFGNLEYLSIDCSNTFFSIYSLNNFKNVYSIKECSIKSSSSEFINGKDLDFLHKCCKLTLIMLNVLSELNLEAFNELHEIQHLEIGAPYIGDLNISDLTTVQKLKSLILYIPNDYMKWISKQFYSLNEINLKILSYEDRIKF